MVFIKFSFDDDIREFSAIWKFSVNNKKNNKSEIKREIERTNIPVLADV